MKRQTRIKASANRASQRLARIGAELTTVNDSLSQEEWLQLRARTGILLSGFNEAMAEIDRTLGIAGAQTRILRYLQLRLQQRVTKEELSGVAGISEWARRVRELRHDHGWSIHSANTRDDLRIGEYVLTLDRPDPGLARNWATARRMRTLRTAGGVPSSKVRVLEFLKAIHPSSADREQIAHVAGKRVDAERVLNELAADGWPVRRCTEDDALTPGGSWLASLTRNVTFDSGLQR